jgi:hypothetical protein
VRIFNQKLPFRNILLAGLITSIICLFTSCAKKAMFQTSTVVPAARGFVKVSKDNNKNYVIKIQLTDLAEVNRLTPPKKTYVIWLVTEEDITRNIGQIKSASSMLSSKLKASFETVSSDKPTKIFITAEDDGNVQFYGSQIVLTTNKF